MKLQLAGKVAVTSIVPGLTSVTVTVFPAMMPHGVEHSSEFCAAVKLAALPPVGAPTLRARAHPATASTPVSFDFIIASLVWLTTYDPEHRSIFCCPQRVNNIFWTSALSNNISWIFIVSATTRRNVP